MKGIELDPVQPWPSASVVIVNWNSGPLLSQCIARLEQQTVAPLQIIVIDNASSDDSVSQLRDLERVTLCAMNENLGFAKGNNHALGLCRGDYVVLLNPDAFAAADWLEQLLRAARQHPEVTVFGSRQLSHSDPDTLDGIGDIYHASGLVWRDRYGKKQLESDLAAREIFSPCAAAAMYRRDVLEAVGGFDEDYFCYVEDIDLGFRLRLAGHRARYVPQAVVYHVGSATTGGQHSDFSVYHGHRNLVWTYIKNMPGLLFWLLLPAHLLLNLGSIAWFALRGKGRVIVRAKVDALAGLPGVWRKRRVVQSNRVVPIRQIWTLLDKRMFRKK